MEVLVRKQAESTV